MALHRDPPNGDSGSHTEDTQSPTEGLSRRLSGTFIDDEQSVSSPPSQGIQLEDEDVVNDEDEEDEDDEYWDSEEEREWESQRGLRAGINEVMDQDWADASGDFTKRYNRMKQHVVATHSAVPHSTTNSSSEISSAPRDGNVLPAANRRKGSASRSAASAAAAASTSATGAGAEGIHLNKVSDQLANYSRYANQISLEPLFPTSAQAPRKGGSEKVLIKDKSDRATNEQVLDPRTRLILFKMLGRGLIDRIDGCVSTGKEANVYHAVTPPVPEGEPDAGQIKHLALKIYKTSILVFKDRDRYVSGEFRFKSGYARSNPRKMVRLWAEKEMRNLRRMKTAGLRVPEAIEVRENVLVMQFMGADEWQASPRLKDAQIPADQMRNLYLEILMILRIIFSRCKLVHADFSEYNILYHENHLWVIDVSQSVEQDHPAAFDFLRNDLQNANDFFARRGVETLGLKKTFEFVTRKLATGEKPETDEEILLEADKLVQWAEEGALQEGQDDDDNQLQPTTSQANGSLTANKTEKPSASDEAVFAQSYIPRALNQVYDIERDVQRVMRGEGDDLIYADITGVADIRKREGVRFQDEIDAEKAQAERGEQESNESESESEASGEEDESGEDEHGERRPRGKKFEDKEEKKKRRAETKEKAREKRSQKMSKAEKARRVKKTSGKGK